MKHKSSSVIMLSGVACVLASGTTRAAAEQHIHSHQGSCQVTVPSDWKQDALIKSNASAPGDAISVVVTSTEGFATLAELKPIIQSSLVPVKTFEDSAQRLWYQYRGSGAGSGWYVGVPGKGVICAAQIGIKNAAQTDLARKIALTVGPVP